MKYKKYSYLLVLILMLLVGMNGVRAAESKTCYYMSSDDSFKATITFTWGYDCPWCHILEHYSQVYIDKRGAVIDHDAELLINWIDSVWSNTPKGSSVTFSDYYKNSTKASASEPSCPKYLVFQECGTFRVWATESQTQAQKAAQEIGANANCNGYYGYSSRAGTPITAEDYYETFADLDTGGTNDPLDCEGLFGDKNDDGDKNDIGDDGVASIAYIVNVVMGYVRVIVPIIIIVLGIIDLSGAVLAGKEDAMKKAQITFVKRVIAGVCVFFSPLLINIIMSLAEIVWEGSGYSSCSI